MLLDVLFLAFVGGECGGEKPELNTAVSAVFLWRAVRFYP